MRRYYHITGKVLFLLTAFSLIYTGVSQAGFILHNGDNAFALKDHSINKPSSKNTSTTSTTNGGSTNTTNNKALQTSSNELQSAATANRTADNTTVTSASPASSATTTSTAAAQTSSISGIAYIDSNLNKVKDADETGKSGIKITLTGSLINGNPITAVSVSSATDGTYTFSGLEPGTYAVTESDLTGWAHTTSAIVKNIVVKSGSSITGIDFGNVGLSRITAIPFNDLNRNGIKDTGEEILSDWSFTLTGTMSDGTTFASKTVVSSSSGAVFFGIYPGTYTLTESSKVGWTNTTPKIVSSINAKSTGGSLSYDFGVSGQAGITGIVFYDTNGNLKQDSGETGVANWNVKLLSSDG